MVQHLSGRQEQLLYATWLQASNTMLLEVDRDCMICFRVSVLLGTGLVLQKKYFALPTTSFDPSHSITVMSVSAYASQVTAPPCILRSSLLRLAVLTNSTLPRSAFPVVLMESYSQVPVAWHCLMAGIIEQFCYKVKERQGYFPFTLLFASSLSEDAIFTHTIQFPHYAC